LLLALSRSRHHCYPFIHPSIHPSIMFTARTSRVVAQRCRLLASSAPLRTTRSVSTRLLVGAVTTTKRVPVRAMACTLDTLLQDTGCSSFSTKEGDAAPPKEEEVEPATEEPVLEADADEAPPEEEEETTSPETESEEQEDKLKTEIQTLKDSLLRSLAEQENTRRIAQRDVQSAKQFAVKSFAKSLLEVSDNLERAMESVPVELRDDKENHAVLASLYEGISMTDAGLVKALESHGVTKYATVGQVFDPNLHDALFEYPDPKGEPGTLGQIMKKGYMLHDRVLRPAEVGVIKKADAEEPSSS